VGPEERRRRKKKRRRLEGSRRGGEGKNEWTSEKEWKREEEKQICFRNRQNDLISFKEHYQKTTEKRLLSGLRLTFIYTCGVLLKAHVKG
jgi:hypothetical protein